MQILMTLMFSLGCGLLLAAFSVTSECRWTIRRNLRRLDGQISRNRVRREGIAFWNYVSSLAVPVFLSVPIGIVITSYFDSRIMPVNQVVAAAKHVTASPADLEALRTLQKDHADWLSQQTGASTTEIRELQRTLWFGWPAIASIAVTLVVMLIWFTLGFSKSAVEHYVSGIRHRRKVYDRVDAEALRLLTPAEQAIAS
jgi:hypothetical protein